MTLPKTKLIKTMPKVEAGPNNKNVKEAKVIINPYERVNTNEMMSTWDCLW